MPWSSTYSIPSWDRRPLRIILCSCLYKQLLDSIVPKTEYKQSKSFGYFDLNRFSWAPFSASNASIVITWLKFCRSSINTLYLRQYWRHQWIKSSMWFSDRVNRLYHSCSSVDLSEGLLYLNRPHFESLSEYWIKIGICSHPNLDIARRRYTQIGDKETSPLRV